ncbi:TetR/AcrR family transcriptional regulator [Chromohalobacter canadensis]|uniref:TetR/AcrR family transcriptional regulator n=1 Tax=Chromohalobacter canadensis TaxID=141389 RepID=A0ABZ0YE75_9GAMM|nr:TetR/AcrR family transcriptional regulator [Chromohalobacter canadensis]MCK0767352.1 TetR/AcrR family transcriptional regulator [Chromohalobacter canadensis]WQH10044.1 TetR/AcrR family transcriptional regulator [Chromohalobacter canadensis]
MAIKEAVRPGGRSARVQEAVHHAVRELQITKSREELSVPQIANKAGVTPSTIYRRWGNLAELLADVSLERLRPDDEPPQTGSLAGDLQAWGEQYLDEMTSLPGQCMLSDIMASAERERRERCYLYSETIMACLRERAVKRGEATPSVEDLMDGVIAPMTYRLLYDLDTATPARLSRWIAQTLPSVDSPD